MRDRRRRWLIDRFQYKLITRMVVYWFIYQLTLWHVLFCWRLLEEGKGNFLQEYGKFFRQSYPMLICFLILVPAVAWDAVKFFHRVAGPLYRFRRTVKEIAAEEPVRYIRLRKGDELTELQDDFNAMLDTLARRRGITLIRENQTWENGDLTADLAIHPPDSVDEERSRAAI